MPNDLAAAVLAVETTLGTNPQGTKADVKTFLQTQHGSDGTHAVVTATSIAVPTITSVTSFDGTTISGLSSTPTAQTIPLGDSNGFLAGWSRYIVGVANYFTMGTNATNYITFPFAQIAIDGTEANVQCVVPSPIKISNLYVLPRTNTLNKDTTVTVRKNGADTTLVVTIPASTATVQSDVTHSVAFAAGDLIDIKISTASGGSGTVALQSFTASMTENG